MSSGSNRSKEDLFVWFPELTAESVEDTEKEPKTERKGD